MSKLAEDTRRHVRPRRLGRARVHGARQRPKSRSRIVCGTALVLGRPAVVRAAGLEAVTVAVTLAGMSSDWLGRYRAGECEGVWDEISRRGERLRDASRAMGAAKDVAAEMMYRVRDNVVVLERRLRSAGYDFAADADGHWPAQVITPPRPTKPTSLAAHHAASTSPTRRPIRSGATTSCTPRTRSSHTYAQLSEMPPFRVGAGRPAIPTSGRR